MHQKSGRSLSIPRKLEKFWFQSSTRILTFQIRNREEISLQSMQQLSKDSEIQCIDEISENSRIYTDELKRKPNPTQRRIRAQQGFLLALHL